VNENDTVGVDEIKFGDNDILAGLVANAVDAEVTILLSDVDGFLMDGKVQSEVREVTAAVEAAAGGTTGLGSGGMISKIRCAKTVTAAGGSLLLINGKKVTLREALQGKAGTLFLPTGTRLDHRSAGSPTPSRRRARSRSTPAAPWRCGRTARACWPSA
jgi:glutamate 5-kinase